MSKSLAERLANIRVDGAFPFRDNPRLAPFLDDVGLYCDGVLYWQHELGMDAADRLDQLPARLSEVLSILNDNEEKARGLRSDRMSCRVGRIVETNFLRLCDGLRRAGHGDVGERLPQWIEDLKVIGTVASKAHYTRPRGPNSAPSLVELVEWLAGFWEAETKTRFTRLWHKGKEPLSPAMQFVFEVISEFAPSSASRLSTITKKVVAARNTPDPVSE